MTDRWCPDFFVIGAYKSGTTTLHHLLRAHPELYLPARKEPSYYAFAGQPADAHPAAATSVRDRSAYRDLFAAAPAGALTGEVSPAYLSVPRAFDALAAEAPDARFVAILRDPVARAYSDYLMYVRDGVEPLHDFAAALAQQDQRSERGLPTGNYLSTGFYGSQLLPYYERFGPDPILVLLFEDFVADVVGSMRAVFAHLGVTPDVPLPADRRFNVSGVPSSRTSRVLLRARHRLAPTLGRAVPERAKQRIDRRLQRRLERPPLDPVVQARLRRLYRDDVALLRRLTGHDLTRWEVGHG